MSEWSHLTKNLDVADHTMSPDDTREILYGREKWNLLIDRDDFIILLSQLIAVPFHFLCPSNNQSKVGSLVNFASSVASAKTEFSPSCRPTRSAAQLSLLMQYRPRLQTCHNGEDLMPCACVSHVQDYSTTVAPVRSATARVVPTATVLWITVRLGLYRLIYRAVSPIKSLILYG